MSEQTPDTPPAPRRQFRRGRENRKLLGVCAGIADYFGLDVVLVRIVWALATVFGLGSLIIAYFVIALVAD